MEDSSFDDVCDLAPTARPPETATEGRAAAAARPAPARTAASLPAARAALGLWAARIASPRQDQLFTYALGISIAIHAVLLAIRFQPFDLRAMLDRGPPLEVALVNAKTKAKPTKADILAQANLDGGGNTDADRRAKTPLPVLPKDSRDTEITVATQKVEVLERQAKELLTQLQERAGADAGAGAGRNERESRAAHCQRVDAAHARGDAPRSADRQGNGRVPEAAQAQVRRRARRGVSLRALRRGLAAQGRARRQSQLSRGRAAAAALRQPAAVGVHSRRRQRRERARSSARRGRKCSMPPP